MIDPIEVARTALVAMNWDGRDPRPAARLIFALVGELNAAGHSEASTTLMLRNIASMLEPE